MNKLGELIRELRGNESLRTAAKRVGISHTYLDTIEKGKDKRSGSEVKPTPETLKLISDAYNYPYKRLMELAGYIKQNKDDDEEISENRLKAIEELKKMSDEDLEFIASIIEKLNKR